MLTVKTNCICFGSEAANRTATADAETDIFMIDTSEELDCMKKFAVTLKLFN